MGDKKTEPMLRREAGQKRVAALLEALRSVDGLREGRPGTFRYRSKAFLHFHYHPEGDIVGDVRIGGDGFTRFDVSTEAGQAELVGAVRSFIARSGYEA